MKSAPTLPRKQHARHRHLNAKLSSLANRHRSHPPLQLLHLHPNPKQIHLVFKLHLHLNLLYNHPLKTTLHHNHLHPVKPLLLKITLQPTLLRSQKQKKKKPKCKLDVPKLMSKQRPKAMSWQSSLNRRGESQMPEGIAYLLKTLSWTHSTPERLFPFSWEKELLQGTVLSSTLKFIARSLDSLALVHMNHQELLMIFDSGQLNSRFCTRSFTARKVFCSGTSTWICIV